MYCKMLYKLVYIYILYNLYMLYNENLPQRKETKRVKTICFSNQKGGVAKTTSALALCARLTQKGYKVLAIDTDPQSNFTYSSGINPQTTSVNVTGVSNEKPCGSS